MTTTTALTTEDLSRAQDDDRWLGYGYLGERSRALNSTDPETAHRAGLVPQVDALLLAHANRCGWTYDEFFAFLNSKNGRWFADEMFGGSPLHSLEVRMSRALGWNLLTAA